MEGLPLRVWVLITAIELILFPYTLVIFRMGQNVPHVNFGTVVQSRKNRGGIILFFSLRPWRLAGKFSPKPKKPDHLKIFFHFLVELLVSINYYTGEFLKGISNLIQGGQG